MNERITLPNEFLLSSAVKTVAQGGCAIIPVKGQSMEPFIHGGHDRVELYSPEHLCVGDLVLAKLDSQKYLLHRIIRFDGPEGVVLMGDGNIFNTESCLRKDIKAKALFILTPDGKRISLDSSKMKSAAILWRHLLPVRGLLLRVFKKIFR